MAKAKDQGTTTEETEAMPRNVHMLKCQLKKYLDSIGGITKARESGERGPQYLFRGIDDLYNKMCLEAANLGLDIDPRVTHKQIDYQTNAKGNVQTHLHITMDIVWTSAWDLTQTTTTAIGEAIDTSDKSSGKAMSYAMKNGTFAALQVPTHGEPMDVESYHHENGPPVQQTAPVHKQPPAAQQEEPAKKPKKEKETGPGPAKAAPPETHGDAPFPNGSGGHIPQAPDEEELVSRVQEIQTFPLLFAFAQDAQNAPDPIRSTLFTCIKARAIELFTEARSQKEVKEGVALVNAMGAPADLKRACNAAYMRFNQ